MSDEAINALPWVCPRCAHFIVRSDGSRPLSHRCPDLAAEVDLVRYVDSTQAATIRADRR